MNQLSQLLISLVDISPAPEEIKREYYTFLKQDALVIKNNPSHHICTFFLPLHIPSQTIYLAHHKKAKDWIPPGGHIDNGEHPIDTIHREFQEELMYLLQKEPIELVTVSIKCICQKSVSCKVHYDFWYIVLMKKQVPFTFLKSEFIDAQWVYKQDIQRTQQRDYREIEQHICNRYFV